MIWNVFKTAQSPAPQIHWTPATCSAQPSQLHYPPYYSLTSNTRDHCFFYREPRFQKWGLPVFLLVQWNIFLLMMNWWWPFYPVLKTRIPSVIFCSYYIGGFHEWHVYFLPLFPPLYTSYTLTRLSSKRLGCVNNNCPLSDINIVGSSVTLL